MNFRKMVLAGSTLAVGSAVFAGSTQASIIDRPFFKVVPVIIVWAADDQSGAANMVTDFIVGSGSTDLITSDGRPLYTGDLSPTEDALATTPLGNLLSITRDSASPIGIDTDDLPNSTFSAFDVSANANLEGDFVRETSFFVASNTGFQIQAEAIDTDESPDDLGLVDISFSMARELTGTNGSITWGTNASDPISETFATIASLNDLATGQEVYSSDTRTATSPGSIVSQSVRFDTTYQLFGEDSYDLSQGHGTIEAEVTYTFFVA